TKSSDKQFAKVNDIITYTTTLTNNGNRQRDRRKSRRRNGNR
ncbi:hypothetical protein, partial [Bacillus cereus]